MFTVLNKKKKSTKKIKKNIAETLFTGGRLKLYQNFALGIKFEAIIQN